MQYEERQEDPVHTGLGNGSNSKKSWDGKALLFSFYSVEKTVLPHHLKELENDLIGNYFEHYRKAPEYQFRNSQ